jgi:hypothetical protein
VSARLPEGAIKQHLFRIPERTIIDSWNPARYDSTGRTDENAFSDAEEMGWEAYFASLFEQVDRKMLDDHKKKYQGELHSYSEHEGARGQGRRA